MGKTIPALPFLNYLSRDYFLNPPRADAIMHPDWRKIDHEASVHKNAIDEAYDKKCLQFQSIRMLDHYKVGGADTIFPQVLHGGSFVSKKAVSSEEFRLFRYLEAPS